MTDTQHTPWRYFSVDRDYLDGILSGDEVRDADDRVVAYCFCETKARLIAAAPETAAERDRLKEANAELLEALIAARAELEELNAEFFGEDYNNPSMNAAIVKHTPKGE